MLYISCPTCGSFLGLKAQQYEEEKEKICSNPKITLSQKEKEITKLIMSMNIRRYCCKMRLMTYKDLINDIQPVS